MIKTGNPNQWSINHPNINDYVDSINTNSLYVGIVNSKIEFCFKFYIGIDESYNKIYNGNWLNDYEYGVIHMVASSGSVRNVFKYILNFVLTKINNIKIDTYKDNKTMLHILDKYGFIRCGDIYIDINHNKSPRIAYQYYKNK